MGTNALKGLMARYPLRGETLIRQKFLDKMPEFDIFLVTLQIHSNLREN